KVQKAITQPTQEQVTINKTRPPDGRRVYVGDERAFEVFTQHYVIDGTTGKYAGTLDTGLLPNPVVSPDGSKLYIADTSYSRYSHGKRNDVIRVYDPRTLTQTDQIDIPENRMLVMTKNSLTNISPDGRYLLYYQFSPTTGVGVVDLKQ